MGGFKTKYPVTTLLLALVGALVDDAAAAGQSVIQKLEDSISLVPQMLALAGQAGSLSGELSALKQSPVDIEAGAEVLIEDLDFSSAKAQSVMAALFPVGEGIVALVAPMQALVVALEA